MLYNSFIVTCNALHLNYLISKKNDRVALYLLRYIGLNGDPQYFTLKLEQN